VKRYSLRVEWQATTAIHQEAEDGEWVTFEESQARIAELEERVDELVIERDKLYEENKHLRMERRVKDEWSPP
jgi:hypothetical protein